MRGEPAQWTWAKNGTDKMRGLPALVDSLESLESLQSLCPPGGMRAHGPDAHLDRNRNTYDDDDDDDDDYADDNNIVLYFWKASGPHWKGKEGNGASGTVSNLRCVATRRST